MSWDVMPPPREGEDCSCCPECSQPPCDPSLAGGICNRECVCDQDEPPSAQAECECSGCRTLMGICFNVHDHTGAKL